MPVSGIADRDSDSGLTCHARDIPPHQRLILSGHTPSHLTLPWLRAAITQSTNHQSLNSSSSWMFMPLAPSLHFRGPPCAAGTTHKEAGRGCAGPPACHICTGGSSRPGSGTGCPFRVCLIGFQSAHRSFRRVLGCCVPDPCILPLLCQFVPWDTVSGMPGRGLEDTPRPANCQSVYARSPSGHHQPGVPPQHGPNNAETDTNRPSAMSPPLTPHFLPGYYPRPGRGHRPSRAGSGPTHTKGWNPEQIVTERASQRAGSLILASACPDRLHRLLHILCPNPPCPGAGLVRLGLGRPAVVDAKTLDRTRTRSANVSLGRSESPRNHATGSPRGGYGARSTVPQRSAGDMRKRGNILSL